MSLVTYTFYLDNAGTPAPGKSPTFDTFIDLEKTVAEGNLRVVAAMEYPEIVELTGGFYYFSFNWETFTGGEYLVKIKCGEDVDFANEEQRFIIMKLDRNDNLSNVVKTIKDSSDDIVTANNTLLKSVNRLLEIESGTWKIEQENGNWYLNLYATDSEGGNARFETSLGSGALFQKHALFNEAGISSPVNPFRRQQVLITNLP